MKRKKKKSDVNRGITLTVGKIVKKKIKIIKK